MDDNSNPVLTVIPGSDPEIKNTPFVIPGLDAGIHFDFESRAYFQL